MKKHDRTTITRRPSATVCGGGPGRVPTRNGARVPHQHPDLGGLKGKVGPILDQAVGALDTLLGYKWLIPDQYEAPLEKLLAALKKVQGWIA